MIEATTVQGDIAPAAPIRLGKWNFYFLAKLLLFWQGWIGFHPMENLAFACLLLMPVRHPRWRTLRAVLAVPAGVTLLYYDSWLPTATRIWAEAGQMSGFSLSYLIEFAGRFVSWPLLAILLICWALYRIAAAYVRLEVLVMAALAAQVMFGSAHGLRPAALASSAGAGAGDRSAAGAPAATSLEGMQRRFFADEARRVVSLGKAGSTPFDIVIIHICSLSWDDLQAVGLTDHPLWKNFDILMRQFNSASSYSGPAAIRLHRATCGQSTHDALFKPAPVACQLMPNLRQAGYETQLAMNHDGHFDDFLKIIQAQGLNTAPMPLTGIGVPMRSFDDSPIHGDSAVLARWQERRAQLSAPQVALYYNTVSLHDGNRLLSRPRSRSTDTYKERVAQLLDELQEFLGQLEPGDRRTVVVVVPEHGAAIRGDKRQIAGLREIASPNITLVPVGVKILGKDARRLGAQVEVTEPTSYLAVSHILSRLLAKPPYADGGYAPSDYVAGLPTTAYVAENPANILVRRADRYYLGQDGGPLEEYSP